MIIRFTPDADAELAEAREWYAHQHEGLDTEFMECIDDSLRESFVIPVFILSSKEVSQARGPFGVFHSLCL